MNIAILSQTLLNNYGGLLQNYALQKVLSNLGHNPMSLDYMRIVRPPLKIFIASWLKSFFYLFIPGKRRHFARLSSLGRRKSWSEDFIANHIKKTRPVQNIAEIASGDFSCFIVGSDQVWRPKYVFDVSHYYLDFVKENRVCKISYAASFGVDDWEYSKKKTRECSKLAKKFKAISVREESGVKLCKEHLGVDATWVLDPTLLLKKDDYLSICENVPFVKERYLAVYVLDENEEVNNTYEREAAVRGLVVKKFHADSKSTLTVPEWLAMFRDASYVVTDSFHGTVFSIIFGKEFKCIYNQGRGAARFESLLKLYNLGKLDEMRQFSLNWLKKALEC